MEGLQFFGYSICDSEFVDNLCTRVGRMGLHIAGGDVSAAQLPLRPCAGIILFNRQGRVWIGRRRRPKWASYAQPDIDDFIWQPPQGGIDKGETARVAAFRELREETGVINATLISELPVWLSYELPSDLLGRCAQGQVCRPAPALVRHAL